ncbi:MAG: response regulator [Massilia sp.]|nr:response regulator [Massilia sp.]
MHDNRTLSVLIVDPNPGMRASLQNMLNQSGISKIEFAASAGNAIKLLAQKSFDIILCEYDLGSGAGHGQGQDGQQLLEDLRHHKLIGMLTIFIMITSERMHSKVVSAAELTPSAYILKPFTVEMMAARIRRAIERRNAFLPTYQLLGQGKQREALRLCAFAQAEHSRFALEFARLRAELHVSLHEFEEAEALYASMLADKPIGWASLGLARTLFAQGRADEAQAVLTHLVETHGTLMATYDLLARVFESQGAPARAQRILETAVAISPHMVRRLRALGEVALDAGDLAAAEKCFKQVLAKARYSEFRAPEDHVNLIKALLIKDDPAQAESVLRDLDKSLRSHPDTAACMAIATALLQEAAGNAAGAVDALGTAVLALPASRGLSGKLKVALARSCLANRLDREATGILLSVINDGTSAVSAQQAPGVFVKAGRPDLADAMGAQLKAQVQALLDLAAEKTALGDFKGAVQTLLDARHISPGNLPLMLAVGTAILRQISELGWDSPLAEQCAGVLATIGKLDPAHPQLSQLHDAHLAAKRKYGIAT